MTQGNGSDQATMQYTLKYNPPMDLAVAKTNLREIKQVLEQLGIVFLLGSGTCLGATRDKALMPWDDDIDLLSVLGVNGLTEAKVDTVADALREKGYFVGEFAMANSKAFATVKNYVRISLECVRIVDDIIHLFPGGFKIPASMFTQPKEIEFLGDRFLVPNPPEDYLRLKYGEEWMVPKKAGEYEIDVVVKIPDAGFVGQSLKIRVIDHEDCPIPEAEVVLVGSGRSRTDQSGYAQLFLPGPDFCSLIIRYPGHEQVLYMEEIEPGQTYVYRADAASKAASDVSGEIGTLGNILLTEEAYTVS
jgi:hypothetical protein